MSNDNPFGAGGQYSGTTLFGSGARGADESTRRNLAYLEQQSRKFNLEANKLRVQLGLPATEEGPSETTPETPVVATTEVLTGQVIYDWFENGGLSKQKLKTLRGYIDSVEVAE